MEDHQSESEIREIEETSSNSELQPLLQSPNTSSNSKTVKTKVPEVEIHLYRQGKGPIDVFKSSLGGWEQDQLEVREILDKYGFKSVFAFKPDSGRGVPIRFNPRNGRSILTYRDGAEIYIDGEPKDSLIKPVTRIVFAVAIITIMITLLSTSRNSQGWMKKLNITGNFPPWILACVVIVFTRSRKRTRDLLKKYGW
ncbi:uncharacterized protein LOC111782248 [Cucurbita pepo subsp. pepo]|uniref:uncharacterized protein LOC111782248 n=1 Tax=Cucurbita pepo subsp. pepo TaxID=3664 RepID=UPI000C9D542D|nr:uncharacterized protein LOC111782248 [Cucurbita pepo subsp. pepo]